MDVDMKSDLAFSVYLARRNLHPYFSMEESGELPLSLLFAYNQYEMYIKEEIRRLSDRENDKEETEWRLRSWRKN